MESNQRIDRQIPLFCDDVFWLKMAIRNYQFVIHWLRLSFKLAQAQIPQEKEQVLRKSHSIQIGIVE